MAVVGEVKDVNRVVYGINSKLSGPIRCTIYVQLIEVVSSGRTLRQSY